MKEKTQKLLEKTESLQDLESLKNQFLAKKENYCFALSRIKKYCR